MGEAPTLVGSITAELDLDMKKWDLKVGEIKDTSKELGSLDPTIKVDANVAEAVAKLDSVRVAEQRVETATRQAANTASTAYIAHERLTAIMEKRGRTDLQVAAATEASARADRNAEASEMKLLAATEALNKAKAEAVRKSFEEAAANEVESKSAEKSFQANNQRVSGLQVLIALAPALLGPATAIAASAVGLGVAFGVMGGAGVAAILGIKKEMADGTAVGNQYAAGLGALKSDFSELGSTSATAMLSAFNNAVGDTNVKMPFLNQALHDGSAALGNMGGTALRGVLDGLQQMNPLIQDGSVQLSKFVTWLFSFNGTNGFTQFIQYARDNLPGTMTLIENLVTLAGRILAAYAPLGPAVLDFLNRFTGLLNGLPLPVLAGIVTTATTIAPAFNIAKTAVNTFGDTAILSALKVDALGVSVNLAVPVVGILTAILAGAAMAMATSAAGTANASAAVQDYTQALKDDDEELGKHVRLQAAKALSDAGAYDAARTLGISQTVLTDSLMGVAGAQDIVNEAVKRGKAFQEDNTQNVISSTSHALVQSEAQRNTAKAIDVVTGALNSQSGAISKSKQDNLDQAAAMNTTTGALTAQQIAMQGQAALYGSSVPVYQAAVKSQQDLADQAAQTTANMIQQNDAAGLLKMALDGLNGKAISAAQAQNAFDSQLANMGTHVDTTGKKIQFTTANIGDMSAASVALRGQLNSQVQGLQAVVEANGGLNDSTGQAKAEMEKMRKQIIDNAVAHGVDKDAVTAYVDKLLTIPASVPPTKLEIDKAKAEADIAAFQAHVDAVHGKTVDLITRESTQKTADTMGTRTNPVTGEQETYVSTPGGSETPGSGTGTATKGTFLGYAHGGDVAYLASGGHPGGPRGSDTVPAWLTPKEFVMKRASADSIGLPALNYMNQTGQLPPQQQQQAQAPVVHVYVGNEQLDSRMYTVAAGAIGEANRDASRRPSR
ncbi:AAA family ATPase [Arthrobacter sp. B2a2-09]|uniref:hypothetical protein n=1 Tax=Arthrobacter sp. B2a2-09 TaxID=2952822 RepID=UPI0022CD8C67|nr:hypothetical protein [Arthrobacter sp. B2a2-09]MCZ9884047.1 hypothetical protein [Arthrobacter sp. B2a2-09]